MPPARPATGLMPPRSSGGTIDAMRAIVGLLAAPVLCLGTAACTATRQQPPPQQPATGAPASPRWPPPVVLVTETAVGNFQHKTDGSNLDGDALAWLVRGRVEGFQDNGLGGGLGFESLATDDPLFDGPGLGSSKATLGDWFAHLSYRVGGGNWCMPLRVGPAFRDYRLKDSGSSERVSYATLGVRGEAEPELALARSDALVWSLNGRAGYTYGWTRVSTDPDTIDADTRSSQYVLEAGTRFYSDQVRLGIGYLYEHESIDASDVILGLQFLGVDTRFQGVVFDFTLRF